jgi:hypothetical protein
VFLLKESMKLTKTFVCSCGAEYSLELSTDLAVDNMLIEARCPACGERRTITAGSLLLNRASGSESGQPSQGEPVAPLSFMDSADSIDYEEGSSTESESPQSPEDSAENSEQSIFNDMFGE